MKITTSPISAKTPYLFLSLIFFSTACLMQAMENCIHPRPRKAEWRISLGRIASEAEVLLADQLVGDGGAEPPGGYMSNHANI
jgi:hypothetical protein